MKCSQKTRITFNLFSQIKKLRYNLNTETTFNRSDVCITSLQSHPHCIPNIVHGYDI